MPTLAPLRPTYFLSFSQFLFKHLWSISRSVCVASCFVLTGSISGQASLEARPATAETQLSVNTKAQLDKLNTSLSAAQALGDAATASKTENALGEFYGDVSEYTKALEFFLHALRDATAASDLRQQVAALVGMGGCYRAQDQVDKATHSFQQALEIASQAGNQDGQMMALSGLGFMCTRTGESQKALDYYNQSLSIARNTKSEDLEAITLSHIGATYSELGEPRKALDSYDQALTIWKRMGDAPGESSTLNGIGIAYFTLGDKKRALDYYEQALTIKRQEGDRAGEAGGLNNIGNAYVDLGESEKALDRYNQALPIWRELGDRTGEASTLANLGSIYSKLGEHRIALDHFNQALTILRQLGDRAAEAGTLSNIGMTHSDLDENREALSYLKQALTKQRDIGDRDGEAETLVNIASVYSELHEYQNALDYSGQGLPIYQKVGDRAGEADALSEIGRAYSHLGQKQKALNYLSRALPIAASTGEPQRQVNILETLFEIEKSDRPSFAILSGKLAVNLLQELRANINGLQEDLQKTYLISIADQYHDLASLLIKQGRLSEAQQVLNLLKDREYRDYVGISNSETLRLLTLSPAERTAEEEYKHSVSLAVEQGRRWSVLQQKGQRTREEEVELKQLSGFLDTSGQMRKNYFALLYKLFSAGHGPDWYRANITDETASLEREIAKMPRTVALYTFVSKDRYSVIVITGSDMVARSFVISDKDLRQKISAFRQTILDPSQDPKPLAQDLYEILIDPIRSDLDKAKAETLIWSLDGVLRYVPFAALYDGKQYLIENYNLSSFTPVSISHLADKPNLRAINAVGMGISESFEDKLEPLPQVRIELESIVRDPNTKGATGVMAGTILLNEKFTQPAMEKQLDGQHAIVHIASHFVIRPGDDSHSYLLMAAEGIGHSSHHMTVAEFREDSKITLDGTELLTLSACHTGIGGSSANGREVDGLATTAQRKGAKAVISSLWQLNDNSTADLMSDFYKRWIDGSGKIMKVEALRQAQLDLLRGSDPEAPASYSMPYYWAPFVLMGNWR